MSGSPPGGLPTIEDVRAAARRIAAHAHRTPVLTSRSLDDALDAELSFKCENLQRAGAFKFRGACNAVFALPETALGRGVATHSSGNHAQALALAARLRGVPATIIMPADAPAVKQAAVAGYGARIVICEPTLDARESTLASVVAAGGQHVVHPYDDFDVISGQGTAALELLADAGELDAVVAPVGGGGLLGGTAVTVSALSPQIRIYGAEPAAADDAARSLASGRIIPAGEVRTIADGLKTSLGRRNFAVLRAARVSIVTVSEAAIVEAMRLVWERMKLLIEPSAAVPVAALLERRAAFDAQRIGIVLSGGNLDLDRLPWQR